MNIGFLLLILFLAVVVLRWLANGKVARIVAAVALILFLLGWVNVRVGVHRDAMHRAIPRPSSPSALTVKLNTKATPHIHDASLDVLWDKLTKSRIDLDADGDTVAEVQNDSDIDVLQEKSTDASGATAEGRQPPEWVKTPPKRVGNVIRQTVVSDPFVTVDECRAQLETQLLPEAVCRRIEELVAPQVGHEVAVHDLLPLGIGIDYVLRDICTNEFTTAVDSSVGEMQKIYVLLEFDNSVDRQLREAWLRHERSSRMISLAQIGALALGGLAMAYGLLRVDTWTRGYYSRELLLGATAVIIAAGVLLFR